MKVSKPLKQNIRKPLLVKTLSFEEVVKLGKKGGSASKRSLVENYNRLAETVNRQFRRSNKAFPEGTGFTRMFLTYVKGRSIRPLKDVSKLSAGQIADKSYLLYRLYHHPSYGIKQARNKKEAINALYNDVKDREWGRDILIPKRKRGESDEEYELRTKDERQRREDNFKQFVAGGHMALLSKTFGSAEAMRIFANANKTDKRFAQFQQDLNLYVNGRLKVNTAMKDYRPWGKYAKEADDIIKEAREDYIGGDLSKESVDTLLNAADVAKDKEEKKILLINAEARQLAQDYYKRKKAGSGTIRK